MLPEPYRHLHERLLRRIPAERLMTDPLRTLAFGSDASFYRLLPKMVVMVEDLADVRTLLSEARALRTPVTFRAAGTSLSGQAVTDSVLAVLGPSWRAHSILGSGSLLRLQPGVIGAHANATLAPYGRKIGPDPASINAATIGGIAANNASGMCCGTSQNSYRTLAAMTVLLADGSMLDTSSEDTRRAFTRSRPDLIRDIRLLAERVRANPALAGRIRRKFSMKNTTGYSLNALVDFEDPVEILQHLMIGSEGTLGFIADITYRTVPEYPHKATALVIFPDIGTACGAVPRLKQCRVDAVELMDRASLRSVEGKAGMPSFLADLAPSVASLLVETRAATSSMLAHHVEEIRRALEDTPLVQPLSFTVDPEEYTALWNIRKGLFPSVGAMRTTGTTVIIEDVAFPLPRLAAATLELQALFQKHGYHEAIIFGHALEGNLHFVFTQDFNTPSEVQRYRAFLDDVTRMVVHTYDGSLKAEHGTGRNMAPFVELEWGEEAFAVMQAIKHALDPDNLLNPGVILNPDREIHVKNLKPLPAADEIVDKCIECGFCEVQCPSRDLTLTPRQRIVVYREMSRLRTTGSDRLRLLSLEQDFRYQGERTCATDGLCATSCPVGIDTGTLVKHIRRTQSTPVARRIAGTLADRMDTTVRILRLTLNAVHGVHVLLGSGVMHWASKAARAISGKRLPLWNPAMPRGADPLPSPDHGGAEDSTVVYFPTCINRAMGVARCDGDLPSVAPAIVRLLHRAGYRVVYPEGVAHLCCGMAFASKGYAAAGDRKAAELEEALLGASGNGLHPVLTDMSPCLHRMRETFRPGLRLYEPVRFLDEILLDRLRPTRLPITVAVHSTCSSDKMGLRAALVRVARRCAEHVIVPEEVGCCGWAGDRGFTFPELNASALGALRAALPAECRAGYSTSRTCEIGLSLHGRIPYRSIVYLVGEATRPAQGEGGREGR